MAKDIFTERAISDEVRDSRPYVAYRTIDDIFAADPQYKTLRGAELADLRKTAAAGPGWVMCRAGAPGAAPIFAELRPDNPVIQRVRNHRHRPDVPSPAGDDPADNWSAHLASRQAGVRLEHRLELTDCLGWHRHVEEKKYTFPMGEGRAARVDVHPLALDRLRGASRVFYCLEGVLKADALLSKGEVAISVPSVNMWYGPRAEAYALLTGGAPVYVVTDSDHLENEKVRLNGMLAVEDLLAHGIDAHFAAPPTKSIDKEGVDDFLARGGRVGDLAVFKAILPPTYSLWIDEQMGPRRRDAVQRDARVLRFLILHSTIAGEVRVSATHIAQYAGISHDAANRALVSLQKLDVLRLAQPPRKRPAPSWLKSKTRVVTEPPLWAILHGELRAEFEESALHRG